MSMRTLAVYNLEDSLEIVKKSIFLQIESVSQ